MAFRPIVSIIAIVLPLIAFTPGCSGPRGSVPLGVGSYAFVSGEFTATATGTLDAMAERAVDALKVRATEVSSRRRGVPGGSTTRVDVRGKLPDGRDALIRLSPLPEPGQVRVSIRIGPLGDEAESARLLEALRAEPSTKAGKGTVGS